MNSDMDNYSEDLYSRFMAWLQQDSVPSATNTTDGSDDDAIGADWEMDDLDPLEMDDLNIVTSIDEATPSRQASTGRRNENANSATPSKAKFMVGLKGEIPTVQNRYHALLKRRLQTEIESHPPRFPWETQIYDYETESYDSVANTAVPQRHWLLPQIERLNLPVSLPETALVQLLEACTTAVQSPLKPGAQMVKAVGSLFPQAQADLNELAGLVLLYPTRSPQAEQLFTNDYETATTTQQVALSLLAAKEIINALTLSVSPNQVVEKQWQTDVGEITIQVEYKLHNQGSQLKVNSRLPRGGSLTLQADQASATAQRTYSGNLSIEVSDLQPNNTYPLEICLSELDRTLILAIAISK